MRSLAGKWLQSVAGSTLSPEPLKRVRDAQKTMLYQQELLWADIPYAENAADTLMIISRLREMAITLRSPGSPCYKDAGLRDQITYGLEWLYTHRYNEFCPPYGNWWFWEIGVPIALLETLLLMGEALDAEWVERLLLPVDKYVGDPALHARWFAAEVQPSTGANLVWKVTASALAAVIRQDGEGLLAARNALLPLFTYASEGDGFYEDGSFIQHNHYAYTGGYGVSLLQDLVRLMVWLHDTPWALPAAAQEMTARWMEHSFVPLMFRGVMPDMVSGREISREESQNHESGHSVITACLRFSRILEGPEQLRLLSRAKEWIIADTYKPYITAAPPDTAAQAIDLLDNERIPPAPEETCCKLFARMDRAVLRGPGFLYSISMFSSRMYSYESINQENLKGWYTSYGMSLLYNSDLGQYSDGYWPTVDPYRLPGTTVTKTLLKDGAGAGRPSSRDFVGGAVLHNKYGAVAMELEDVVHASGGLTGRLSWFLLGDRVVCLGSEIQSHGPAAVETIIDNRRCSPGVGDVITADGTKICRTAGHMETLQPKWMHMRGSAGRADIGIFFPVKSTVYALREHRQGSWKANHAAGSAQRLERSYQTIWFDHGAAPQAAQYAYVLLPEYSEAATASFAESPSLRIVERSGQAHAVEDSERGITAVHFWQPDWYRSAGIACSSQATVIIHWHPAGWSLAVADPTQKQRRPVEIEIGMGNRLGAGTEGGRDNPLPRVVSKSERITVQQAEAGKVRLRFDPEGAGGASFHAEFGC
ncbi:polysaccharide lyase 8 family protein [Paenibacillus piscarius]|uniref:polysaccharide lyase 8 family protein n=1 Tax=Paenibacillus piscarius TaxID=1089681 RepID=UPI001EE82B86|nr:polysaccharide lyase 8 family protein [Paenibacillus piscarius]